MSNYIEDSINLLNDKYGNLITVGSISGFTPEIQRQLHVLGIHIRDITNTCSNIIATNYAGDTNLTKLYEEQLDTKIMRAMEWLEQCG